MILTISRASPSSIAPREACPTRCPLLGGGWLGLIGAFAIRCGARFTSSGEGHAETTKKGKGGKPLTKAFAKGSQGMCGTLDIILGQFLVHFGPPTHLSAPCPTPPRRVARSAVLRAVCHRVLTGACNLMLRPIHGGHPFRGGELLSKDQIIRQRKEKEVLLAWAWFGPFPHALISYMPPSACRVRDGAM